MNHSGKWLAFVLLAGACGRPLISIESGAEPGTDDSTTSTSSTSTSETSTSETSTSETSEWDSGFVPMSDHGPISNCDPFAQDCPDGEKCVAWGSTGGNWDANKCVPVLGEQATGEPCTYDGTLEATDNCDETGACWELIEVDGEAVGTCHAFCTGFADEPECPPGSQCLDDLITVCIETCDPVLQDCSDGLACYWGNSGFNCIFTTMDIPPGEPCGYVNDCVEGSLCVDSGWFPSCAGASCCTPFCQLGAGDQPCEVVPGTTCEPFFEEDMAPPGYDHVGVCVVPS